MLPATFTVLPQLPLTPNNKIDRSLLLKQAGDQFQRSAATFVPPSTEIERTIAAVWQKALGLERIGRHENFFDLGGHSLLAVEVIQKLQQELNCQITAVQLFNYATVALLAQYLSQSTPVEHTAQQKADQRDMLQAGKNRLQVQRQRRLKGQEVIEK